MMREEADRQNAVDTEIPIATIQEFFAIEVCV